MSKSKALSQTGEASPDRYLDELNGQCQLREIHGSAAALKSTEAVGRNGSSTTPALDTNVSVRFIADEAIVGRYLASRAGLCAWCGLAAAGPPSMLLVLARSPLIRLQRSM